MGYTTDFSGRLYTDKPFTAEQAQKLEDFSEERHEPNGGGGYPGYYCQWIPTPDGDGIEWDGNEKFYSYVEWLEYLIKHFIKPWGHNLNGSMKWFGEDNADMGVIEVTDNEVKVKYARISFEEE